MGKSGSPSQYLMFAGRCMEEGCSKATVPGLRTGKLTLLSLLDAIKRLFFQGDKGKLYERVGLILGLGTAFLMWIILVSSK